MKANKVLNRLLRWCRTVLGDLRSQIVGLCFLCLLSLSGTIKLKSILQKSIPLWVAILFLLFVLFGCAILFLVQHHSLTRPRKPKSYKYCPDCGSSISAESPDKYCDCEYGTEYIVNCPNCGKKITRANSNVCAQCGHRFLPTRIPIT